MTAATVTTHDASSTGAGKLPWTEPGREPPAEVKRHVEGLEP